MQIKVGSRQITLDTRIGGGGEGDVYTSGKEDIAYKIYKPARQTKEKQKKILAYLIMFGMLPIILVLNVIL